MAIAMHFGLWEFLFMAFGLRNAAQPLQWLKDNILMGLDYVFSFLDDDSVFSKSREQHWTHLCTLFAILAAKGLALTGKPLLLLPRRPSSPRCPWPSPSLELFSPWLLTPLTHMSERQVGQHWQPLGFFSKKLSKTEVNYSSFDQELLAAVSGLKHFSSQLEGRPFQLWTDHKPLIFALSRVSPLTSGRQQRHLAFIAEYTNHVRTRYV